MKKYFFIISISICLVGVLSVPLRASAIDLGNGLLQQAGQEAGYDPTTDETTLSKNIGKIINVVLSIVGVLFTVLMVYGGFLWMTARGSDEQITKARNLIIAAIIGLVITLGAYSISAFVVPRILAASTV